MNVSRRVAADLKRLESIQLPPDITGCIVVTSRDLKKCGWTDEQINILQELATEPC